jgi:hypothetical protein
MCYIFGNNIYVYVNCRHTDHSLDLLIVIINGWQLIYHKIWDYYSSADEDQILLGYELFMVCVAIILENYILYTIGRYLVAEIARIMYISELWWS